MRYLLFAVLALVPLALVGTLVWQGNKAPPAEHAAARPAGGDADAVLRGLFDFKLAAALGHTLRADVDALNNDKGLFDYIDGAAPIFIERHFRKLAATELSTPEGSDLVCDVYDMATPDNAQSIFDKEKSAQAKPVEDWPGAIAGPMSFVFHQARYYVKLTAFDAKAEAALPLVARALKEKMK